MKRVALGLACLLPGPTLALGLWEMMEDKYPVRTPRDYWAARFSGAPSYFRFDGFDWFRTPGIPLHGEWPSRAPLEGLDAALLPFAEEFVSARVSAEGWSPSVVADLNLLTGADAGDDQDAWRAWRADHPAAVDEERARAFLASRSSDDLKLRDVFEADARNRISRWLGETLGFWTGWIVLVLGTFVIRITPGRPGRVAQAACVALKGWFLALLLFAAAMTPWLVFGYGDGAFTTYEAPGAVVYSGPYWWGGGIRHGDTIGYRTFVEIIGTPCLALLQHAPLPKAVLDDLRLDVGITFAGLLLYGAAASILGGSIGLLRTPRP